MLVVVVFDLFVPFLSGTKSNPGRPISALSISEAMAGIGGDGIAAPTIALRSWFVAKHTIAKLTGLGIRLERLNGLLLSSRCFELKNVANKAAIGTVVPSMGKTDSVGSAHILDLLITVRTSSSAGALALSPSS